MEEAETYIPKRLFHYTSINSLAMILHHRTLRFTKISNLNDPLEGRTADLDGAARLIFCSSWTAYEEDTIPMWKMYSELVGVRLAVSPSRMFKNAGEIKREGSGPGSFNYAKLTPELPYSTKGNTRFFSQRHSFQDIWGPDAVRYEEPHRAVADQVTGTAASIRDGERVEDLIARLTQVGLLKSKHWEFENEVRFRLTFNRFISIKGLSPEEFCDVMEVDSDYIDVSLSDNFFEGASVLLGPLCEPAHEILIESLIEKYAPSVTISKSDIQIR